MKINSDLKIENTDYTVKNLVDTLDKTKNNLSSLTTYTAVEKLTGEKWIDGRPIYRKSFTGKSSSTAGSSTSPESTVVGNMGGDYTHYNIINISGSIMSNSYNTFPLSTPITSGVGTYVVIMSDGEIRLRIASVNFTNRPYNLTIEYTKTEDSEEVV